MEETVSSAANQVEDIVIRFPNLLSTILIIIFAVIISFLISKFIDKFVMKKSMKPGETNRFGMILKTFSRVFIVIITLVLVLQANGVNVAAAIAGLGIVGIVVGLAFQDFMKDIIRGFQIMLDGFFVVGDVIVVEGRSGRVINFSLKATKVQYLDDYSIITICNRNLEKVIVLSRQWDIDLPIDFDEPAEKVRNVLTETAKKIAEIPDIEDCRFEGTQNLSDVAIIYKMRMFSDPCLTPGLRRAALKIIQDDLEAANIQITFNHIKVTE